MEERRTYAVVHSPIQLRLLFLVAGLMFAFGVLAGSYIWFLWDLLEQVLPGSGLLVEDAIYYRGKITLFSGFIVIFLGLFLVLRISHRIVGPMFRIQDELQKMRDKREIWMITIRDRDYIHGFAKELNGLLKEVEFQKLNDEN